MEDQNMSGQTIPGSIQQPPYVVADHRHNGVDAPQISFQDIKQRKIYVHHTIQGTAAATAGNYGTFYIVPMPCYVSGFKEVHQTAGSDGSAVTVTLEKLTGTTAPDSGKELLTTALSLKATANTVQTGTIVSTLTSGIPDKRLAAGDRLCMKDSGTLTAVNNVTVVVELTII